MNSKTLIATLAIAAAVATVGSQAIAKTGPNQQAATEIHTITGSWTSGEDGGSFLANQEDGSATKVQGLPIVNSDNSPVIVHVCPNGQEWAEVVLVYRTTHALDPIAGAGSPITGPYVIRTPVMKGVRTKVWGDEVQPLIPVPCPNYEAPSKLRKLPPAPHPTWR